MTLIRRVQIKNFRSIKSLDVDCNYMTLFAGQNDAGKSNILRALNLFFNDHTNHMTAFFFEDDHYALNNPVKQAKEITITVEFELPESYQDTNGGRIVWTKTWRNHGLIKDNDYHGVRIGKNRLGRESREKLEIPPKSNVHALLRQIEFIYVPAIKDSHYFDSLRGDIYRLISDVAAKSFRESSRDFETSIADHLSGLTDDIVNMIGLETNLALPKDLSHIFERLDFLSGDNQFTVSLNNRGDGIKARHIPVILKFMAEKKKETQVRGGAPFVFIWAYEEPENNVEMSRCFSMADEFWSYVENNIAQVFMTTHSPVFYNLTNNNDADNPWATLHHVVLNDTSVGSQLVRDEDDLDDRMGITRLIAPYLHREEALWRERRESLDETRRFAEEESQPVFVEGPSDRIIFGKAFELFAPHVAERVSVKTVDQAGTEYVKNKLVAWERHWKNEPDKKRAYGIFDSDDDGIAANSDLDRQVKIKQKTPIEKILLPPPTHLQNLCHNVGMKIPIVLETYYPKSVWEHANQQGWLERKNPRSVITDAQFDQMIDDGKDIQELLEENYHHAIDHSFESEAKRKAAQYVVDHAEAEELIVEFKDLVRIISEFLFPDEQHPWQHEAAE